MCTWYPSYTWFIQFRYWWRTWLLRDLRGFLRDLKHISLRLTRAVCGVVLDVPEDKAQSIWSRVAVVAACALLYAFMCSPMLWHVKCANSIPGKDTVGKNT